MQVKVTFLGTGTSQGVPLIACHCPVCSSTDARDKRLRCSVMLTVNGKNYIIDTGPDFRQQMLRAHVDHVEAVVFTHAHKDHIAGFDDIRAYNFAQKRKMDVYADAHVQAQMRREFYYIFEETRYPGIPEINLHTIGLEPFHIGDVLFTPIEVLHLRLPVLGFRVGDFTYITDANFISDKEKEKIKGSRVVVLNALRREPHVSHFTLDEAIALAGELGAGQTLLTHMSHQLGLHEDVCKQLPSHIQLAYDGLVVEV